MTDDIRIVPYDPSWPTLFQKEKQLLKNLLVGQSVTAIHHIGSTAIPGMPAKPVIDILISVSSVDRARLTYPEILNRARYDYWHDNPKKDRLFFVKGMPPRGDGRSHHIHVYEDEDLIKDHLMFRDYLREKPHEASRYARLKQKLAEQYSEDRESYTEGKSGYIKAILDKAGRSNTRQ